MTLPSKFVHPPRLAARLVTLFAPADKAESILGDFLEEFTHLASASGIHAARRWYWRQTLRTIAQLAAAAFRGAPLSTAAAIIGGFLLTRVVATWLNQAIVAVLDRFRIFESQPDVYLFSVTYGWLIGRLILATAIGGLVAIAAKGRELTATTTLALFQIALSITAVIVARPWDSQWVLSTQPWMLAFSIATVVGGIIVRTRRSAVMPPLAPS
jgi:hypothetical protein